MWIIFVSICASESYMTSLAWLCFMRIGEGLITGTCLPDWSCHKMLGYSAHQSISIGGTRCSSAPENLPDPPVKNFDVQWRCSPSRGDSEKMIFFQISVPEFCAFALVYQFLRLSSGHRPICGRRLIAIHQFPGSEELWPGCGLTKGHKDAFIRHSERRYTFVLFYLEYLMKISEFTRYLSGWRSPFEGQEMLKPIGLLAF
jgi:hypothetical protein